MISIFKDARFLSDTPHGEMQTPLHFPAFPFLNIMASPEAMLTPLPCQMIRSMDSCLSNSHSRYQIRRVPYLLLLSKFAVLEDRESKKTYQVEMEDVASRAPMEVESLRQCSGVRNW